MVIIYKFCKKEILIQPPGEPREHHQGEVRPKSSSYTKFHTHFIIFLEKKTYLLRTAKRGGGKEGDEETLATGWNPKKSGKSTKKLDFLRAMSPKL